MKKGFTLIELLVVVLIIGILSSVALPQYQRTVLKSRAAEAWTNLKSINTALQAYCLAYPSAKDDFSVLRNEIDLEVNDSKNFTYTGYFDCKTAAYQYIYANYQGSNIQLAINPRTGARSCKGSACKDIGFTKFAGTDGSICLCGGVSTTCYYAD